MRRRKRNPNRLIALAAVAVFLLGAIFLGIFLNQEAEVIFQENLRFEMEEAVCYDDLVQEVKNGILLDGEKALTVPKEPGIVSVTVRVRNRIGTEGEFAVNVEFYRKDPAVTVSIQAKSDTIKIYENDAVDLLNGVSALDSLGNSLPVTVVGTMDLSRAGTYSLHYVAEDGNGHSASLPFTLTVLPSPFDENGKMKDGTYETITGHTLVITDSTAYVDGYLFVNKSFSLPKSYLGGSRALTDETNAAYRAMQKAAANDGVTITLKSGTRNWNDQNYIFNNYTREHGLEKALTFSARPGHSEHQSGLGMDLITSSSQEAANDPVIKKALEWLDQNAYKYGLILRYPEGKTDEHGYIYEPWHYRYVGTELAEILYNNGDWITMEAYFGLDSAYRGY